MRHKVRQQAFMPEMTLDEVIAANLAALIEKRGIPIARIAKRLGVSRANVYDMTGPRPGRPMREFRWNEIVRLAGALDVLVYDLVLPPKDVRVTGAGWMTGLLEREMLDPENIPEELLDIEIGALDRADLGLALFGWWKAIPSVGELRGVREAAMGVKDRRASEVERSAEIQRAELEALQTLTTQVDELRRKIEAMQEEE